MNLDLNSRLNLQIVTDLSFQVTNLLVQASVVCMLDVFNNELLLELHTSKLVFLVA